MSLCLYAQRYTAGPVAYVIGFSTASALAHLGGVALAELSRPILGLRKDLVESR